MAGFIANQHRLLLVLNRRFHAPLSASQVAFYYVTASHLNPKDSKVSPVARGRSRVQHKPAEGQEHEGSTQRKVFKSEISLLQKQMRGDDFRVSPELRKLCLEDFPAERERQVKQKPAPEAKSKDCEVVFGVAPCFLALTQGRRRVRKLFVKDGEASHRASVLKVCEEAHLRGVRVPSGQQEGAGQDVQWGSPSGSVPACQSPELPHRGLCTQQERCSTVARSGENPRPHEPRRHPALCLFPRGGQSRQQSSLHLPAVSSGQQGELGHYGGDGGVWIWKPCRDVEAEDGAGLAGGWHSGTGSRSVADAHHQVFRL